MGYCDHQCLSIILSKLSVNTISHQSIGDEKWYVTLLCPSGWPGKGAQRGVTITNLGGEGVNMGEKKNRRPSPQYLRSLVNGNGMTTQELDVFGLD